MNEYDRNPQPLSYGRTPVAWDSRRYGLEKWVRGYGREATVFFVRNGPFFFVDPVYRDRIGPALEKELSPSLIWVPDLAESTVAHLNRPEKGQFGSHTHPNMVAILNEDLRGDAVVGCGANDGSLEGVAAKKGSGPLILIDIDEEALDRAGRMLSLNGLVQGHDFFLFLMDLRDTEGIVQRVQEIVGPERRVTLLSNIGIWPDTLYRGVTNQQSIAVARRLPNVTRVIAGGYMGESPGVSRTSWRWLPADGLPKDQASLTEIGFSIGKDLSTYADPGDKYHAAAFVARRELAGLEEKTWDPPAVEEYYRGVRAAAHEAANALFHFKIFLSDIFPSTPQPVPKPVEVQECEEAARRVRTALDSWTQIEQPITEQNAEANGRRLREGADHVRSGLGELEQSAKEAIRAMRQMGVREGDVHNFQVTVLEAVGSMQLVIRGRFDTRGDPTLGDINPSIERVCSYYSGNYRDALAVSFEPAENLPPVRVDHRLVETVWANLIRNAGEAERDARTAKTGKGGTLTLRPPVSMRFSTRREGDTVVVTVADQGPGIPPKVLPRIFEAGFSTKGGGSARGIGLALCKRIVEDAGGTIQADSVVGRGATFTIRFPAVLRQEEAKAGMEERRLLIPYDELVSAAAESARTGWRALWARLVGFVRPPQPQFHLRLPGQPEGKFVRASGVGVAIPWQRFFEMGSAGLVFAPESYFRGGEFRVEQGNRHAQMVALPERDEEGNFKLVLRSTHPFTRNTATKNITSYANQPGEYSIVRGPKVIEIATHTPLFLSWVAPMTVQGLLNRLSDEIESGSPDVRWTLLALTLRDYDSASEVDRFAVWDRFLGLMNDPGWWSSHPAAHVDIVNSFLKLKGDPLRIRNAVLVLETRLKESQEAATAAEKTGDEQTMKAARNEQAVMASIYDQLDAKLWASGPQAGMEESADAAVRRLLGEVVSPSVPKGQRIPLLAQRLPSLDPAQRRAFFSGLVWAPDRPAIGRMMADVLRGESAAAASIKSHVLEAAREDPSGVFLLSVRMSLAQAGYNAAAPRVYGSVLQEVLDAAGNLRPGWEASSVRTLLVNVWLAASDATMALFRERADLFVKEEGGLPAGSLPVSSLSEEIQVYEAMMNQYDKRAALSRQAAGPTSVSPAKIEGSFSWLSFCVQQELVYQRDLMMGMVPREDSQEAHWTVERRKSAREACHDLERVFADPLSKDTDPIVRLHALERLVEAKRLYADFLLSAGDGAPALHLLQEVYDIQQRRILPLIRERQQALGMAGLEELHLDEISSGSTQQVMNLLLNHLSGQLSRRGQGDITPAQVVEWMVGRTGILDVGAGSDVELVKWFRARGAPRVYGLDKSFRPELLISDPYLRRGTFQDRWPFGDGQFPLVISTFALNLEEAPPDLSYGTYYGLVASELARVLAKDGLAVLAPGAVEFPELANALAQEGLQALKLPGPIYLVAHEPLDSMLDRIAQEIKPQLAGVEETAQVLLKAAEEAWRGVAWTPPYEEMSKPLLPVFYQPETFYAASLPAKAGIPFVVLVTSPEQREAVERLLQGLRADPQRVQVRLVQDMEQGIADVARDFPQHRLHPVDKKQPDWLAQLLAGLEEMGVIPLGDLEPALQKTEEYFAQFV